MEMEKELKINGYPAYQATSENIMAAYEAAETESEKAEIAKYYMESRLKYEVCRKDESKDENFGRKFEDFVNGRMCDPRKVADRMARAHRYLVQQMFSVCYEFIRILAEHFDKGLYDPRDEWACKTSKKMWEAIND